MISLRIDTVNKSKLSFRDIIKTNSECDYLYAPRLAEPSVGPENFALGSSSEI